MSIIVARSFSTSRCVFTVLQIQLPPSKSLQRSIFSSLLIADILLCFLALPIGFWQGSIYSSWLAESGLEVETTDIEMLVGALWIMLLVVMLPATIVAWVGLFQYRNWARWLYLLLMLAGNLLAIPLGCFDYSFQWGVLTAIVDLMGPVEGALVAIVFFSPLAAEFSTDNTDCDVEVVS